MTRRLQICGLVGLTGVFVLSGLAQAQPKAGAKGGAPAAASANVSAPTVSAGTNPGAPNDKLPAPAAGDASGVSNAGDPALGSADTLEAATTTGVAEEGNGSKRLPNTGGEPWLWAMGGSLIAASALLMRRRIS